MPKTLFFEMPSQLRILRDVMRDLADGERHLLFIGNQGTGKNKLADRLLQLMHIQSPDKSYYLLGRC